MAVMTDQERSQLLESIGNVMTRKHDWQSLRDDWKKPAIGLANRTSDFVELGLFGLLVPEESGGLDAGDVDALTALEGISYHNASGPIMETMWVMAPVLKMLPPSDWRDERLEGLAGGELHAVGTQDQRLISDLGEVSYFTTISEQELICRSVSELDYEQVSTIVPGRKLYELGLSPVSKTVGVSSDSPEIMDEFRRRVRIGHAAVLNGLSRRILDKTVEYVKNREQFGRPVGSFQAIKHILADATASLYLAQNSTWAAARRLQGNPAAANASSLAAQIASIEAHDLANDAGLQCHGGIGFTWEYDLHELLKRGKSMQYYFASQSSLLAELAKEIENEGFVWD